MPIKTLGSLGKIRVGRVTGNSHILFLALRYIYLDPKAVLKHNIEVKDFLVTLHDCKF